MACIVMAVIILMSILLGAELGPKADPTTTTYTPRPEWYFFFLFELLRVVKPPALVFMATIGIPTICLVLLLLLPFTTGARSATRCGGRSRPPPASRRSRRWPTSRCSGPTAGAPTEIEWTRAPVREGQGGDGVVRLPGLPQDRRERQHARPEPHRDRRRARQGRDRADAREPDVADAVVRAVPAAEPRAVQQARPVRRLPQGRQ